MMKALKMKEYIKRLIDSIDDEKNLKLIKIFIEGFIKSDK